MGIPSDPIRDFGMRSGRERLAELGREGWELVAVDSDNAWFKRPLDEAERCPSRAALNRTGMQSDLRRTVPLLLLLDERPG